jgi:thiamine monophosphate synthase
VRSASVKLEFKVTQKENSEKILHKLTDYFGCGSVVIDNKKTATKKFRVSSLKNILEIIIPHFDLYPCLTSKFLNYND